jgi:hypothetical protein
MPNLVALEAAAGSAGFAPVPPPRPGGGPLRLERRPLAACAAIEPHWRDLAGRALEANPFFEPDFALPAAQHLVSFRDVSVLLVWEGESEAQRRLLGFVPSMHLRRLFGHEELTGWSDRRLASATPLIDTARADRVIAALLAPPGRWGGAMRRDLTLPDIDLEGPLALALLRAAEAASCAATLGAYPSGGNPQPIAGAPELAALRHGLSRHGRLAFAEAASRQELRDMVELVLALEASGARARAGSAALQDVRESAFLRAMTRNLARTHQCRVGLLSLDEQPVAGAILIGKGPRLWLYAGVEDERYASFAALAQLVAFMRKRGRAREIVGDIPGPHPVLDAVSIGEFRLLRTSETRARTAAAQISPPLAGVAG